MTESDVFKGFTNPLVCLLETVTSEHLSSDVIGKNISRFYSFEFLLSKTVISFALETNCRELLSSFTILFLLSLFLRVTIFLFSEVVIYIGPGANPIK